MLPGNVKHEESKAQTPFHEVQAKTAEEKKLLQRQIDQLVYELYGLTDEEIQIVEEATR